MPLTGAELIKQHRARQRAKGLRLVQLWLPDTRSRRFAAQVAHDIAALKETQEDKSFGEALERAGLADLREARRAAGAVVTASVGDPAGKPRPFVVLRSDHFAEHTLVTLVAFSTTPNETPTLRVLVEASADNGLRETSLAMIDRIVSVHMERIGEVIGQLADVDLTAITHAVAVYLGIADPLHRARRKRA